MVLDLSDPEYQVDDSVLPDHPDRILASATLDVIFGVGYIATMTIPVVLFSAGCAVANLIKKA